MALNAARQAVILRTAISDITARRRQGRAGRGVSAEALAESVARAIRAKFGEETGYSQNQANAIARRAVVSANQARSINRRTVTAVPASELPIDPNLAGRIERIHYDIVIRGTAADGRAIAFRADVYTDQVMTRAQLLEHALANMSSLDVFRRTGTPSIVTDGTQPAPTITVVGAGRRG